MLRQRRFLLVESIAAVALIVAPFVLPHLGFAPTTIDRILIMGLVGIGFDLLFGYTGLLSFGQSAFFGSGGMVAAWLLTQTSFGNTIVAVLIGTVVAGVIGYLVGLVALRRTGIYFAMITVAIAEVFFFVEFNPLSQFTGGENGLPGVPPPNLSLGFTTLTFDGSLSMYAFFAFWYFVALVLALRIVRSPVGLVLRAIRENPLRAQALGHNILRYKLLVFVIAAMYAGFGGGLLGLMQGFMPPDAFMFSTSGEIVIMTAIGGAGTLVGPLLGATVWLYLSDFFQTVLKLGATWKLVLGLVFVLLVIFLRHGLVGGIKDLYELMTGRPRRNATPEEPAAGAIGDPAVASATPPTVVAAGAGASGPPAAARPSPRAEGARTASHLRKRAGFSGPILQATGLSKHYGGVIANSDIDFSVNAGELRGIIGPNGAGKSTFFKMLTCEVPPTSGTIMFEGRDITGKSVTDVCQLGLTKSYQVNQLFDGLTVGENVTIAALAALRGTFRLDLLRTPRSIPGLRETVEHTLELVSLTGRRDTPVSDLAYGEKRRLEVGLALASSPSLLLLDEPLAGMSPSERVETVKLLKSIAEGRTLIIIDHDMDALFNLAERVTVLQEGRVLVEGTPDEIKSNAQVQEAYLGGVHEELAQ